ncbi:MAG: hypothetical protein ABF980_11130 [Liquorilactobacillus satsumensis]|uniref:hypothetical protein n=1 Tax=Liquorilactobacillus satsumensis TaxID=259059 RepID=UPI0039EB01F5
MPNKQFWGRTRLSKQIVFVITALLITIGLTACGNNQTKQDDQSTAASVSSKNNNPYQNLSKSKAEQVKKADTAVENVFKVNDKFERQDAKTDPNVINSRPDNYVAPVVSKTEDKATTAIAKIKGNDTNTKDIRRAYTDVVNVVKDSSLINMQTARSHIADLKDSKLATHMEKEYEQSMVVLVVRHTNYAESQVLDMTKPLSKKKLKAAQAKAAAESASISSSIAAESSNMAKPASDVSQSSSAVQASQATSATKASTQTTTAQATTPARNTASTYRAAASSTYHAPVQSTTQRSSTQQTYHAASSSTYHAPAQSSTQHTTAENSTNHNAVTSTKTPTVEDNAKTDNINGNNTTAGHTMDGGW